MATQADKLDALLAAIVVQHPNVREMHACDGKNVRVVMHDGSMLTFSIPVIGTAPATIECPQLDAPVAPPEAN